MTATPKDLQAVMERLIHALSDAQETFGLMSEGEGDDPEVYRRMANVGFEAIGEALRACVQDPPESADEGKFGRSPTDLARSSGATRTQASSESITEEKEATPNVQVNIDKESKSEFVQNQGQLKDPEQAYICGPCRTRMRMPQDQSSIQSSYPRCYCLQL